MKCRRWGSLGGVAAAVAGFVLAMMPWCGSLAAEDTAGGLELLEQEAFQAAAERVAPSVIRIETVGGLERAGSVRFGNGPTTATVVSADGYLVASAFRFLSHPDSVLAQLADGSRKPVRVIATDHSRLLTLLKIEPERPLSVPEVAPAAEVRVGEWAIAVGRTYEGDVPNVAVGVVSALDRIWGKAIQTDAAISPSNYGGPLVDIRGRVLGIVTPMSPESGDELAGYEWYNSGIGFAVPMRDVQAILPRLKEGKDLHAGLLGVRFAGGGSMLETPVIEVVQADSPGAKAGLKAGDRISAVAGHATGRLADLRTQLAQFYAGDRVRLTVVREGKPVEAEVELVGAVAERGGKR